MGKIILGKSDGQVGPCTDYLKHGTHKVYVYISWLLSVMLRHGYALKAMLLSTVTHIPKKRRKF